MSATLRGKDVLGGELTLPLLGVGSATLDVNATTLPTGAAQLVYEVGGKATTYSGTIVESNAYGGRVKVRFVLGAGKLSTELPALGYGEVPAATVVRDIIATAGEALAEGVSDELRDTILPSWHRAKGTGNRALQTLAEHLGVGFRVLPTGLVWLGKETWSQFKAPFEEKGPDANGVAVYAPSAPDIVPGVNLAGKRVSTVVHSFSGSLRSSVTMLKDATSSGDREKAAQAAFVKQQIPQLDRMSLYEARVIAQRADGTLDLKCDNATIGDCPGTPIWHGLPGMSVTVAPGARVKVGFDAASPTGRFCLTFKTEAEALSITITADTISLRADEVLLGDGTDRLLRSGDPLDILGVQAGAGVTGAVATLAAAVTEPGPAPTGFSRVKG